MDTDRREEAMIFSEKQEMEIEHLGGKIQTVAILGAGAVGCYFIAGLCEKLGENLWIIADGSRKVRLEQDGLMINGRKAALHVKTPEEAKNVDLLIVAVKYGSLRESLNDIAQIVGEETMVMSVMNGVDSEEIIGGRIGMQHMIYSMIKIASERSGSSVSFNPEVTEGIYFGEADGSLSCRIGELENLFNGSGVRFHISEDILKKIWAKYALNISMNLPQAIIGCGLGGYRDSEYVMDISRKLKEEVVAVALASGIDIREEKAAGFDSSTVASKARFSTLQDLDAGRHTEIDMFSGTLINLGRNLGVPTPYNELVLDIIKALEEKNDGKFDYE